MIGNPWRNRIPAGHARDRGTAADASPATPAPATAPALYEMSEQQIAAMPLPRLALALLRELDQGGDNSQTAWRLRYFSSVPQWLGNPAPPPRASGMDGDSEAALALGEAWQFLFSHLLLCDDIARTTSNSRTLGLFRITRRGRAVLASGLDALRAADAD